MMKKTGVNKNERLYFSALSKSQDPSRFILDLCVETVEILTCGFQKAAKLMEIF